MTDKEKILAFLEGMSKGCCPKETKEIIINKIIPWINDLPKEPVSNELTDEIKSWFKQWSENEMEWSREDIWDTAEHFANWQKQQLMKGAEECYIRRNRYTKKNVLNGFDVTCDAIQRLKGGDKVKVIVIKED